MFVRATVIANCDRHRWFSNFVQAAKLVCLLPGIAALTLAVVVGNPCLHAAENENIELGGFQQRIRPLLETHCIHCHGADAHEADVAFSSMTSKAAILGETDLWQRVRQALESGQMPPDPADTNFTEQHRQRLIDWLQNWVQQIDWTSDEFRHPGPSFIRQLTPYEYMRSMRDLFRMTEIPFARLGIEQSYPKEGHEYVNQTLSQTLTTEDLDRYLRAGEEVVKQLLGDDSGTWRKTKVGRWRYRKAAKKARPQILFVQPSAPDEGGLSEEEASSQILNRFARRAFRRPITSSEQEELHSIFRESRRSGGSYEESLRFAMTAVVASPHFLLRIEEDQAPEGSDRVYPVAPYELATRLSYFLWSSIPDERLLEKAGTGELVDDAVLEAEVERMLLDPKAESLTEHFASQWLQLRRMQQPSIPDRRGFPKLTNELKDAFRREITSFFDHLRVDDRSILEMLDCDYTYANQELASFYELSDSSAIDAPQDQMVRVSLQPQDHRGGLLGMGGYLWMTSHASRTKPTARGTWILEVILGTPPPPPPPDAGSFAAVEEGQPEPKNFREKLMLHAADKSCAGCHRKIDPLGFALENFDPIGNWREKQAGDPIDNVGKLPSGEQFEGFEALREVIKRKKDQFTRNFVSQMLQYALGRDLLYSDRGTVELVARRVESRDYRFSAVMKGIVLSRAFRYRTNLDSVYDTN